LKEFLINEVLGYSIRIFARKGKKALMKDRAWLIFTRTVLEMISSLKWFNKSKTL
jgi:hypothetical protein